MPNIGEIKKSQEIKYGGNPYIKLIWHACVDCGKQRWVAKRGSQPRHLRCNSCAAALRIPYRGNKAPGWKGGRIRIRKGYIGIRLQPDDFFYSMAGKTGYVTEHRLIVAKQRNRCLLPWEVVHHKNGIKDDNRLDNLELLPTKKYHLIDTTVKVRISKLEARVTLLEGENILLRTQVEELLRSQL